MTTPSPWLLAVPLLTLTGCATFRDDGGLGPVQEAARQHLGLEVRWARTDTDAADHARRVEALLGEPLTQGAAVQLALLNHAGLQASLFDLGIAEADLVAASRLPNPGFSLGRLRRGDEVEIERGVHLDLARLLFLPLTRELEQRRVREAQSAAAGRVLAHAAETRKAWVQAVAAQQAVGYARQVMEAAEAGAELARRMGQAGNFNALQQAREQAFHADAALGVARAEQARVATRERLIRLLGLWGTQTEFRLPDRLPNLPAQPRELPEVERLAIAQRLDVQTARVATERIARDLGLTKATRVVNVLELGAVRNGSNEAPTQRGWEIAFELPLFDFGTARVAKAENVYRQSLYRAADVAITARSEVREAYAAYRSAWDIARHQRDEIVPLRQRIADENLLRYNGMLIGVFDLLADARGQIAAVQGAIDAQRDFWLAQADLELALVGKPQLPSAAFISGPAPAPAAGDGH